MTETVRRRRSIMRLAAEHKDIREHTLQYLDFRPPAWLQAPHEMHEVQFELFTKANEAISAMRQLMELREERYFALCPKNVDHTFDIHKASIERLLQWKPDLDESNPTLAPAAKITPHGLHFYLDPINYAAFTMEYIGRVEVFVAGPYAAWTQHKAHVQRVASCILSGVDYMTWRHWWDTAFVNAMWKWEVCLEGLIFPTWEETVDEIYLMVLDRVEDPTELANELCSSRTASGTNTQSVFTAADYFATSR